MFIALGAGVIIHNKNKNGKPHFRTLHGKVRLMKSKQGGIAVDLQMQQRLCFCQGVFAWSTPYCVCCEPGILKQLGWMCAAHPLGVCCTQCSRHVWTVYALLSDPLFGLLYTYNLDFSCMPHFSPPPLSSLRKPAFHGPTHCPTPTPLCQPLNSWAC